MSTRGSTPSAEAGASIASWLSCLAAPLVLSLAAGCGNQDPMERSSAEDVRRANEDSVKFLVRGDLERSSMESLRALDLARAVDDIGGQAEALHNLAAAHRLDGRLDDAMDELVASESLFREVERKDGIARSLLAQGTIHLERGARARARVCLEQALVEAPRGIDAEVLVGLSALRLEDGSVAGAREAAERARSRAESGPVLADALLALARADSAAGKRAEARAAALRALDLYREHDRRLGLARALALLGETDEADGRADPAARWFERAAGVYAGLGMWDEADAASARAGAR